MVPHLSIPMNLKRLKRNMQEGCEESTKSLLREAIRAANLELLTNIQVECHKNGWKQTGLEASTAIVRVCVFCHIP